MALYNYLAKNQIGETVKGVVDAPSLEVAGQTLREKGLVIIWIKEKSRKSLGDYLPTLTSRIRPQDRVLFTRQLAVMASATLPLVQSLRILSHQIDSFKLKHVVSELADEVEGGTKLSVALDRHQQVFGYFYVNMVKSGETSGRLDEVLSYLADQEEKDYNLLSRIKGAMIYPAFILTGLVIVGTVMMIFVVPQLTRVLSESQQTLPFSTQLLIGASSFMATFWWVLALLIVAVIALVRILINTTPGRNWWDQLKLRVPLFGRLLQRVYLVRMTRSLGTLLRGGVPLTQSLTVVEQVLQNSSYRHLVQAAIKEVEDGSPLALVFQNSRLVPPMVGQMISVGEQTGQLDQILTKITSFYEQEIENYINNLVTLIEPVIMIVMGVGVGLMVAAIILPLYNLASAI